MTQTHDWAKGAERRLLDAALPHVPELGWTSRLAAAAARGAGFTVPEAELLLPHGGADLAALLWRRHDEAAMALLAELDPAALKIRERIRRGVQARIQAAMTDEAATRRLQGFLVLPQNLALGSRLVWASADQLWRWAGDTATDENHYSKRAILSGVLTSVLAVRLTSGEAAAWTQLDRSIERVMAFERFKAKFRGKDLAAELAGALGKMRYGV